MLLSNADAKQKVVTAGGWWDKCWNVFSIQAKWHKLKAGLQTITFKNKIMLALDCCFLGDYNLKTLLFASEHCHSCFSCQHRSINIFYLNHWINWVSARQCLWLKQAGKWFFTCGKQKKGYLVRVSGVLEAAESLCRLPRANILGSCQPCRSLALNSTGTCNHSCRRQIFVGGLDVVTFYSSSTEMMVIWGLLVHWVVKLSDALMSPVFTELRQNLTKHVWSVGRKRKKVTKNQL